jgi:site-specific DNA-methyltransferase (adenine-specific)
MVKKVKAALNRTIDISEEEIQKYSKDLVTINKPVSKTGIINKIINQDLFSLLDYLPKSFVDLLFIDPPYNLSKTFNSNKFTQKTIENYSLWIESFISKLSSTLKPTASIYFCGDWHSSTSIHLVLSKYFKVRNRITWEREKGRGAKYNWKNNSEDIWYCTVSNEFKFHPENVKLKRKVLAPYKENGNPKDWEKNELGNFRMTFPSNLWTDITIPFWSMPENTIHPTQKPEKLLAKILLASTEEGDVVFDPFMGSGTSCVIAKKLKRKFVGIELDKYYSLLALKRLKMAENDDSIQGFANGIFWDRNTFGLQNK